MNTAATLAFTSAIFCGVVALAVVWKERRSAVHLFFVAGMGLLAMESVCSGFSWLAAGVAWDKMIYWQHCKLWAGSLLPGTWLLFTLCYGRGNYREFLVRWKFLL